MTNRTLVAVLLAGLVACSGGKKSDPGDKGGATPAAADAAPAPAASTECPANEVLEKHVRATWSVPPEHKLELSCMPGRFPAPGWAIAAVIDASESTSRFLVLAAADQTVVAQSEPASIAPWYRDEGGGLVTFTPVDFDGDGVDELTFTESMMKGGSRSGAYTVLRLADRAIAKVHTVTTESGNDVGGAEDPGDEWACEAQVKTVPAAKGQRLVVDGKILSGKTDDCLLGHHVFELRGGTFAEVK